MTKEPYPLAAARELRDRAVDDAAAALAEAIAKHEDAQALLTGAEQTLETHESEGRNFESSERTRGASSAAVLQQVQAFRRMRAQARVHLTEAVTTARLVVEQRGAQVSEARAALAAARAEAEAVARHEERWRDEKRRAAERKEELEAEEAVQARMHHSDD